MLILAHCRRVFRHSLYLYFMNIDYRIEVIETRIYPCSFFVCLIGVAVDGFNALLVRVCWDRKYSLLKSYLMSYLTGIIPPAVFTPLREFMVGHLLCVSNSSTLVHVILKKPLKSLKITYSMRIIAQELSYLMYI